MADLHEQLLADCEARHRGWITATNKPFHCDVWLDGKLLHQVFAVHRKTGRVRVHDAPIRLDKHRKRPIARTLRGSVIEVVPHG